MKVGHYYRWHKNEGCPNRCDHSLWHGDKHSKYRVLKIIRDNDMLIETIDGSIVTPITSQFVLVKLIKVYPIP